MGSYKQRRSRKPLTIGQLRLRLQDAINSIEPVFLDGEYDEDSIRLKIQAANAVSGLVRTATKIAEVDEIEERITALEELLNIKSNGQKTAHYKN